MTTGVTRSAKYLSPSWQKRQVDSRPSVVLVTEAKMCMVSYNLRTPVVKAPVRGQGLQSVRTPTATPTATAGKKSQPKLVHCHTTKLWYIGTVKNNAAEPASPRAVPRVVA